MKRKRWTEATRATFLKALTKHPDVSKAAKAAGFSRSRVYEIRGEDASFAAEWDEAEQIGIDAVEAGLIKRVTEGTIKPIFYKGRKVATVREYDHKSAAWLLEKRRAERYGPRNGDGDPNKTEGLAIVALADVLVAALNRAARHRAQVIEQRAIEADSGLTVDANEA